MKPLLINFKKYKGYTDQSFHISEALNVFTGKSDSGKSAFVQGLCLAITGKTDSRKIVQIGETQAHILLSDNTNTITLSKGKINKFVHTTPSEEITLSKIDASSISENHKFVNLDRTNIQLQKEDFFLIDISSGKRAKKLNQIVGLEIVSKSTSALKSHLKSLENEFKYLTKSQQEKKEQVQSTEWVDMADEAHKGIAIAIESLKGTLLLEHELHALYEAYRTTKSKLSGDIYDEAIVLLKSILNDYNILDKLSSDFSDVRYSVNKYNKLKASIDSTKIPELDIEDDFKKLERLESVYTSLSKNARQLVSIRKQRQSLAHELALIEEELSGTKICPTCGTDIGDRE